MVKFIFGGFFEVAESGRDHRDLMRVAQVKRVMNCCLFWNGLLGACGLSVSAPARKISQQKPRGVTTACHITSIT